MRIYSQGMICHKCILSEMRFGTRKMRCYSHYDTSVTATVRSLQVHGFEQELGTMAAVAPDLHAVVHCDLLVAAVVSSGEVVLKMEVQDHGCC